MDILPILLEALDETLTAELACIRAMAGVGAILLATSTASFVLALRRQ